MEMYLDEDDEVFEISEWLQSESLQPEQTPACQTYWEVYYQ